MCEERDNHQLDKELLTNRLRHLEGEVETSKNSLNEKAREIRILEVRHVHRPISWFRRINPLGEQTMTTGLSAVYFSFAFLLCV